MRTRLQRIRALSAAQWRFVAISALLLAPIQIMLKSRGLKRTAATLAARSDRPLGRSDRAEATSMAEAVSLVAGRKVVGALCLGRSLLLWFLLRRRGMDAELVVGTKSPIDDAWMAHAWVELDSEPVNDDADVREHYGSFGLDLPRLRPPSTGRTSERG
jgi:transglutaminase-like putative cysteine protease